MHMGDTLGGYSFYNEEWTETIEEPRFIDHGAVTADVFAPDSQLMEINSKSGLYPLYLTYNIYRARLREMTFSPETLEEHLAIWDKALAENIFVVCKTPMAKRITKRTLLGFRSGNTNMWAPEDLINKIKNQPDLFISRIMKPKKWGATTATHMNFKAVVGNPPYQIMDGGGNGSSAVPVYNDFVEIVKKINPSYLSMIMPAKWYSGGKGLNDFRNSMLKDKHISKMVDFPNYRDVFPYAEIAGGVSYFLRDLNYDGDCEFHSIVGSNRLITRRDLGEYEVLVRDETAVGIIRKIWNRCKVLGVDKNMSSAISIRMPFGIPSTYKYKETGIPCWFKQRVGLKYISPSDFKDEYSLLNKWKILIPFAPIAGQTDFTKPLSIYNINNIKEAKPGECCSETYLVAGAFDSEKEMKNFKVYLTSKVFRFLLLQSVISQNITRDCFKFIPNFETYSLEYDDEHLCKIMGINIEEFKYICARIKN